jgi:hypothetical protein
MRAMDVKTVKSGLLEFLLITAISVSVILAFWTGSAGAKDDLGNAPPRNAVIMVDAESGPCAGTLEAENTGIVSGVVTANGVALAGAHVSLKRALYDCSEYRGTTTGADGSYSISMSSGQSYLKITPPKNENGNVYAPYYYNNQYTQCGEAQPVTIIAGNTTTININLTQPGGVITGTVVSHDGKPISEAWVYCGRWATDRSYYGASTNAEGRFTAGPFYPASDYTCWTYDNGKSLYYDNTTESSKRTLITVQLNSVTPDINFQMSKPMGQATKVVVIPLN